MAEQDLKINISVDDHNASDKLKGIHSLLKDINQSVGSLNNNGGLPATNRLLKEFAGALKELSSVNGANIYSLGKNVNHMLVTLGRLDVSKYSANIDKTTAQLGKMAQSFVGLSGDSGTMAKGAEALSHVPEYFTKLTDLEADDLKNVSETLFEVAKATTAASKTGSGIKSLKDGLEGLPNALRDFQGVSVYKENIEEVKKTFEALEDVKAKGGSGVEGLATGIGKIPAALKDFGEASSYSGQITQVANTFKELAPAVAEISKYGNGIEGLAKGLREMPSALLGFKDAVVYAHNIKELGKTLDSLGSTVSSVDSETTRSFRSLASALTSLRTAGNDEKLDEKFQRLSVTIQKFAESLDALSESKAQKIYNLGVGLKSLVDASRGLDRTKKAMDDLHKSAFSSTLNKALKGLVSQLKKLPGLAVSAAKALGRLFSTPFKPIINGIRELTERFTRFFHSVGRIALYRAIRSGIKMITQGAKEGIDNLYMWSQIVGETFAPTMDHLASEFLYLKNSVGAALSPAIQALEPIVTDLVHRFIDLLNTVNEFIAVISGKEYFRRALYVATTYGDQLEDSLDGAGKSAKELKDILMDFDQLNLITTPKDRTHGNEDETPDYEGMFELVPTDESILSAINKLDWKELGKKLSYKITEMLVGIDWNGLRNKAVRFSQNFAGFLNGIFASERMFKKLGESVANGLNIIAESIDTFVTETDWSALGRSLAASFKKFLEKLDAKTLGRAIVAPMRIVANLVHGFVDNMDSSDWKLLADTIYYGIKSAMESIPWSTLIPDLVELTGGFVQAFAAAIRGVASGKGEIAKGVKNANWSGLGETIKDALKGIFESVDGPFSKTNIATIEFFSKIIDKIVKAFNRLKNNGAIKAFLKAFNNTAVTGLTNVLKLLDSLDLSSLVGGISDLVYGLSSIIQAVSDIAGLVTKITAFVQKFMSVGPTISTILSVIGKALETIGGVISGVVDLLSGNFMSGFAKILSNAIIKPTLDFVDTVSRFIENVARPFMSDEQKAGWDSWHDKIRDIKNQFDEMPEKLDESYNAETAYYAKSESAFGNYVDNMEQERARLRAAFKSETEDQLDDALKQAQDFYDRGLIDQKSYQHLIEMYVDGNIDGMKRALGAATSVNNQAIEQHKNKLKDLLNRGKITVAEYFTLLDKVSNGSKEEVDKAISEIDRLARTVGHTLNEINKGSFNWGADLVKNMTRGIKENEEKATAAASQVANNIKRVLAFSEPEEGPLSDFHTYMPDMLDLMAQGIRENAYKVENEVLALAGTVSGIRDIPINPTKDASGTQDMASGIYEANAEERALLRELITAVKEQRLTISPSATLGKVVNQSTRLYAGVTG